MKLITLAVAVALVASLSATQAVAQASPNPILEITPFDPTREFVSSDVIQIPPDDTETFWAHIYWEGHEGQQVHIADTSWHATIEPETGATSTVEEWYAHECQWVTVCQWFQWNKVHTVGVPCTYITFQADILLDDGQGNVYGGGPIWSNTITKHIVPEPSSLLALGSGALGLVGLIFRRRR